MDIKKYTAIKLAVVVLLAFIASWSISTSNYVLPVIAFIVSYLVLLYLRGKVKGVIADERDYEIGGKAARWAIQIYSWIAVLVMFVLYAKRALNPSYEAIAAVLAYSTCFLMLVYALIFRFYNNVNVLDKKSLKKKIYIALGILVLLALIVAGLRLFSGEDNWMCQNGEWVQHGHPDFPAPNVECKK
jgi:uncharacterized membrane protein